MLIITFFNFLHCLKMLFVTQNPRFILSYEKAQVNRTNIVQQHPRILILTRNIALKQRSTFVTST